MIPGRHHDRRARRIRGPVAAAATLLVASSMVAIVSAAPAASSATAATQPDCPWVHSLAPIPARVSELLGRMTLDDKLAMVDGVGVFNIGTSGYANQVAANPALCIPALSLEDGPGGVADGVPGVTQLPAPVALASTWDPALARAYGAVVGSEERGKGAGVNLAPSVNIVRDPRWGRAFQVYGEDPYLSGQTAAGYIGGVRSQDVMSEVNAFAVYNQETNRNTPADDAIVSQRAEQEIYLPQFHAAVSQGGAAGVMCGLSMINGEYACQNDYLLANVLDQQWHFPGFVASDFGATHSTVPSALAGLDIQLPGGADFGPDYYGAALKQAVQSGQVPMATLNDMVSRILTEMFRFGLFDHPPTGSLTTVVTTPEHAAVGQQVAEAGTVLLKNSGNVLPIQPGSDKSVAVIGSDAGQNALTSGGGSAGVIAPYVVTPEQGISKRGAASGVTVSYAQGDVPVTGALATVPASAFGSGLAASYYNNTTMSGSPVATGTVPDLDLSWDGKPPAAGVNASGWSATFTGTIDLPVAGTYQMSLLGGLATVTIDGKQVFPNGPVQVGGAARASVSLPAGKTSIEVGYADPAPGFAADGVTLGWAPPADLLGQAVAAAKRADVAVVFASNYEREGADLASIDLPTSENQLISAVAAANPDTVVVLNTGSAVTMPWLSQVKGVIEAWYPGQDDGTDIAAVLFGDVNPSGKLPVTFPVSLAQVPASTPAQWPGVNGTVQYSEGILVGYRWYTTKGITPLFPFGTGLSYTSFAFSRLSVQRGPDGAISVTADVTNTGHRAGADVAQLYVGDPASAGEPAEQLKGFQRVTLQPGQTEPVHFTLDQSALAWWNGHWTVTPGPYSLMVGDSSANLPLTAHVAVSS